MLLVPTPLAILARKQDEAWDGTSNALYVTTIWGSGASRLFTVNIVRDWYSTIRCGQASVVLWSTTPFLNACRMKMKKHWEKFPFYSFKLCVFSSVETPLQESQNIVAQDRAMLCWLFKEFPVIPTPALSCSFCRPPSLFYSWVFSLLWTSS